MRVHRSAHARNFTVLPNDMLQFRMLSYTAKGLLVDLLSRPDGWREDSRLMADTSPQGRGAIRKALRELTAAGFYRVEKIRMPDGTIVSENHVYDTPQPVPQPSTTRPVPGAANSGGSDALIKNRYQEPTLPAEATAVEAAVAEVTAVEAAVAEAAVEPPGEAPAVPDEQTRAAVAALYRAIRPEPRLRLGEAEARTLAPLVAQWLERGATHADLARALVPGLPVPMHSPTAILRDRLERKMPPDQPPARPAAARLPECIKCHDPVPEPGICRPCAGLGTPRRPAVGGGASATLAGAARVRDAMRAARAALQSSVAPWAAENSPTVP
ncbi:hypothetical protein [Kitasatospora sp. NPDC059673]|uniref:hypothetical protein n=1 Tax=Kitasatospora sp. NPDC059673 TaxID=3346901 RepID=UPI0036B2F09D